MPLSEQIKKLEVAACTPSPLDSTKFNPQVILPYDLITQHVQAAMQDFLDFIGFVNHQMNTKRIERIESMLMPANFYNLTGELMCSSLP